MVEASNRRGRLPLLPPPGRAEESHDGSRRPDGPWWPVHARQCRSRLQGLQLAKAVDGAGRVAGVSPLARRRLRRLTGRCLNHWTLTRSGGRAFNGLAREHSSDGRERGDRELESRGGTRMIRRSALVIVLLIAAVSVVSWPAEAAPPGRPEPADAAETIGGAININTAD